MKAFILLLLLISTFFYSFGADGGQQSFFSMSLPKPVASGWQKIEAWEKKSQGDQMEFSGSVILPMLDEESCVLVFIRNYNVTPLAMREKPLALPFQFFGNDEGTGCYNWNINFSPNGFTITTCMGSLLEAAYLRKQADIEYQYFVFPKEFLKATRLGAAKLHNLPYTEVAKLAGAFKH